MKSPLKHSKILPTIFCTILILSLGACTSKKKEEKPAEEKQTGAQPSAEADAEALKKAKEEEVAKIKQIQEVVVKIESEKADLVKAQEVLKAGQKALAEEQEKLKGAVEAHEKLKIELDQAKEEFEKAQANAADPKELDDARKKVADIEAKFAQKDAQLEVARQRAEAAEKDLLKQTEDCKTKTDELEKKLAENEKIKETEEEEGDGNDEEEDQDSPEKIAGTTDYDFMGSSTDLASLQKLNNCISYAVCKPVRTSFVGGNPESQLHHYVTLKPEELEKVLNACNISHIGFAVTVTDRSDHDRVLQFPDHQATYSNVVPNPVDFLDKMTLDQIQQNLKQIQQLLAEKKYDLAIETTLSLFDIPTHNYKFSYSPTFTSSAAETDHDNQSVVIGNDSVDDEYGLLKSIRHEAEHVQQWAYHTSCNGISAFSKNNMRERSAYLNDLLNIKKFTTNPLKIMLSELDSKFGFFQYIDESAI